MEYYSYLLPFSIIFIGLLSIYVVKQQTVVIVERFGKFSRCAYPGLNFIIPIVETKAGHVNLRVQQLDVHVETKTKDNVFVKINVSVQYQIRNDKIYEAFYKLESPGRQIQSFVFDVVRAKVPNIDLDDVFAKKDEIAVDVKNELKETMEGFGYEIIKALVTDIEPNQNVKDAMNEINTALRLRVAAQERAEAEKIVRIKQAEAEAEANILHGKGIAGQRHAIIEGLGVSVEEILKHAPYMQNNDIMNTILVIQYFDMLKEIGTNSNTNTLFLSHSPDHPTALKEQLMEAIFAAQSALKEPKGK